MSRVARPHRSARYKILIVVIPLTLILAVVCCVGTEIASWFTPEEPVESGEYLAEANEVLGWEDPCEAFAAADLVSEIGVSGSADISESSPGEFETNSITGNTAHCDISYDTKVCGEVLEEGGGAFSWFDVEVDVSSEMDDARAGFEVLIEDYESDVRFDTDLASVSDPWNDGRVYGSQLLGNASRIVAAVVLADFYRVEVTIDLDGGDECSPDLEEIAAIITEKYLPTLHDSIESRLEEAD